MMQASNRLPALLRGWAQAAVFSSSLLVSTLALIAGGSAQALTCEFTNADGFTTCSYGDQWEGGGLLDLADPGPIPPDIFTPVTDQWLDTNYESEDGYYYFPTDKQIKLVKSHSEVSGFISWDWIDVNENGTWRIPPDPDYTDIWGFFGFFDDFFSLVIEKEYIVRITEPGYYFSDALLVADGYEDASVTQDIYTVVGGSKGILLGSLTFDGSTIDIPFLPLFGEGYQELYIVNTIDPGTTGSITYYVNGYLQEVPGPLPLLGAGTAFGFSRKLRRRLHAARVSPTS